MFISSNLLQTICDSVLCLAITFFISSVGLVTFIIRYTSDNAVMKQLLNLNHNMGFSLNLAYRYRCIGKGDRLAS